MHTKGLQTWLMDTAESVLRNSSSVSLTNPSEHVDVADAHDESTYPFVGITLISFVPVNVGIGNEDLLTTGENTDTNGNFTGVEQVLLRDFVVDVAPVTDDDFALRDQLTDELSLGFAQTVEQNSVPDDITQLSIGETSSSGRADSFVRSNGVEISGRLHTHTDTDLPELTDVSWSVDATHNDSTAPAYPDEYQ